MSKGQWRNHIKKTGICLNCGAIFLVKPHRGIYCSRACSNEHRVGPLSQSWKGGVSQEYVIKTCKKDKCERCGSTRYLRAHHIDRDRNINRVETLCQSCHTYEHRVHDDLGRFTSGDIGVHE
jgi:hypothetical protein